MAKHKRLAIHLQLCPCGTQRFYSSPDPYQTIEVINSALFTPQFGSQETIEGVPLTHGAEHVRNSNCLSDKGHEVCECALVWLLLHRHVVFTSTCMNTHTDSHPTQSTQFYLIFLSSTLIEYLTQFAFFSFFNPDTFFS